MFRCELCDTIVPARTPATKIVLQTRPRTYEPRGGDRNERRGFRGRRGPRKRPPFDKGGVGTEIVREASVCPRCAANAAAEASLSVGQESE
jgi:hypothetical protein